MINVRLRSYLHGPTSTTADELFWNLWISHQGLNTKQTLSWIGSGRWSVSAKREDKEPHKSYSGITTAGRIARATICFQALALQSVKDKICIGIPGGQF